MAKSGKIQGVSTVRPNANANAKTPRYLTTVYTREFWDAGEWELQPYLRPVELIEKSIHGNTICTFRFDYGDIKREDRETRAHEMPRDVLGKFVCIRVMPDPPPPPQLKAGFTLWAGIIPRESIDVGGVKLDPAGGIPFPEASGTQTITARGFEYLLDKRRLLTVPVLPAGHDGSPDPSFQRVNVVPTFNLRRKSGLAFQGNMSRFRLIQTGDDLEPETHVYSQDGDTWNHMAIIRFALAWSDNWLSIKEPHFQLSTDSANLDTFLGLVVSEGIVADDRSILSLIRSLIDQRRGIDATIRFSVNKTNGFPEGNIELAIYSTIDVDVAMGDRILPANPNQVDVSIDGDVDEQVSIELTDVQKYDEIVVQGEPMVVTFTAAGFGVLQDEELTTSRARKWAQFAPAWSDSRMTAFRAANLATRSLPKYERVLRRFKLVGGPVQGPSEPFDWEPPFGIAVDGVALHPFVLPDGSHTMQSVSSTDPIVIQANSPFGNLDVKMLRELPLTHTADIEQEKADVVFQKPMAFCRQMKPFGGGVREPTDEEVWFPVDAPPLPADKYDDVQEDVPDRPDVSARVSVSDRDLEFDIHFTRGAQVLGYSDLTESDVAGESPAPVFDWRWMVMTIAVQTDYRPSIVVEGLGGTVNGPNKLVIRVPGAHYWLAPEGGVVHGVSSAGKLLMYNGPWLSLLSPLPSDFPTEGILRNDMQQLLDVALAASVWFSRKRSSLKLTRVGIIDIFPIGTWVRSLLQGIQRSNIGTVVTGRTFDFDRQRTTIRTGLFSIDPRL